MATKLVGRFTTSRDFELLTALVCSPLTVAQLWKWSQSFAAGAFASQRSVLDRLQKLRLGGWVRRWPLAGIASRGGSSPDYYKLTPAGLKLLFGQSAAPPTKHFFAEIAVARHHHTHSLAEFLAATAVAAHRHGFRLHDVHPENTLRLDVNGEQLIPDHRFDLLGTDARYRFLIEQDCSTETIRSTKHDDTIHRKLRLHDAHQDIARERHRVVFVTTRSRSRLTNILAAAAAIVRNRDRTLFLGVYLPDYLNASDPVGESLFQDHRGRRLPLIPSRRAQMGNAVAPLIDINILSTTPSPPL